MATINQLSRQGRTPKRKRNKTPALDSCPQKKGVCRKIIIRKPKKPNSSNRKLTRVQLSNNKFITSYIPGEGHNLQQYSLVLIRGGRIKDMPGIKYRCIRGKYDLQSLPNRRKGRSKYGTKKDQVNTY